MEESFLPSGKNSLQERIFPTFREDLFPEGREGRTPFREDLPQGRFFLERISILYSLQGRIFSTFRGESSLREELPSGKNFPCLRGTTPFREEASLFLGKNSIQGRIFPNFREEPPLKKIFPQGRTPFRKESSLEGVT